MMNIFLVYPDLDKLLNVFRIVLIIDNTQKTNKYIILLLEIVGVASTELIYVVTFALFEI